MVTCHRECSPAPAVQVLDFGECRHLLPEAGSNSYLTCGWHALLKDLCYHRGAMGRASKRNSIWQDKQEIGRVLQRLYRGKSPSHVSHRTITGLEQEVNRVFQKEEGWKLLWLFWQWKGSGIKKEMVWCLFKPADQGKAGQMAEIFLYKHMQHRNKQEKEAAWRLEELYVNSNYRNTVE